MASPRTATLALGSALTCMGPPMASLPMAQQGVGKGPAEATGREEFCQTREGIKVAEQIKTTENH